MSATNQFEDDLLDLLFTNVTAPNIGDATGIAGGTAGSIQVSLHTATLSDTDTLSTASEAAYTSYARETVARSVAGQQAQSITMRRLLLPQQRVVVKPKLISV
jgi:hypothetical protein